MRGGRDGLVELSMVIGLVDLRWLGQIFGLGEMSLVQ